MVELRFKPGLCNYKANVFNHRRQGKEIFILLAKPVDVVVSGGDAVWGGLWGALPTGRGATRN